MQLRGCDGQMLSIWRPS